MRLPLVAAAALVLLCAPGAGARASASEKKEQERAERALREGEFEAAEKMFRALVERDAKDIAARLGLSYTQLKQRNLRDAYDNAARAIALDPLNARAHSLLGSVLLAAGDFPVSVEEFKTALSVNQNDALAVAGLSMINFYENRPLAALAGLRRAVELDSGEPDFVFNYAQAAARSERYREAADAYEAFLRIAPRTDADRRARIRGLIEFLRFLSTQGQLYSHGGAPLTTLKFDLVNSRPVVEVRLNGSKRPARFVIDTGSGMCVVASATAERLGIKPIARGGLARAVGGGGRFEIVYGFLDSVQMGEARLSNVPVYIRDFQNEQEPVDGYIGLSVLSNYLASVDYGARTLTLQRGDAHPPDQPAADAASVAGVGAPAARIGATAVAGVAPPVPPAAAAGLVRDFEVPIRATSSGFWSGSLKVEGVEKPVNFIIDTGATVSVVSQQLAERESLERFAQKMKLRVYGAAGVSDDVPLLLLPRVSFGPYTHANLAAAVLDMNPINETSGFEQTGILGGNVLRYFRLTFDFQRAVVRFEMIPGYVPAPLQHDVTVTPQSY
jgi:predicted aspartyl protease/Tfp pilus assembly protein PilF